MPVNRYVIKKFIIASLVFYAALLCLVWLSPIEFTASRINSIWSVVAYWATESAGREGTVVLIFIVGFILSFRSRIFVRKLVIFFRFTVTTMTLLAVVALFNERVLKPSLKYHRPSHTYMIKQTHSPAALDSLYLLTSNDRRDFFQKLILSDTIAFKGVDQRILDHWVYEAGYSFPSGHSFNAWMIAVMIAFSIYELATERWRKFFIVPFAWAALVAVSRVAVGAHSALDVSVGGMMGLVIATALVSIPALQKLILPGKETHRNG